MADRVPSRPDQRLAKLRSVAEAKDGKLTRKGAHRMRVTVGAKGLTLHLEPVSDEV